MLISSPTDMWMDPRIVQNFKIPYFRIETSFIVNIVKIPNNHIALATKRT